MLGLTSLQYCMVDDNNFSKAAADPDLQHTCAPVFPPWHCREDPFWLLRNKILTDKATTVTIAKAKPDRGTHINNDSFSYHLLKNNAALAAHSTVLVEPPHCSASGAGASSNERLHARMALTGQTSAPCPSREAS